MLFQFSQLLRLAELCGLMPDVETNSKDLQMVVDLISGMGEEEERDGLAKSPSLVGLGHNGVCWTTRN